MKTMGIAFEEGHANRYINVADIMHELFMSISTGMMFRRGVGAHNQDLIKVINELASSTFFFIEDFFPLLKPLDLSGQIKRLKMAKENFPTLWSPSLTTA